MHHCVDTILTGAAGHTHATEPLLAARSAATALLTTLAAIEHHLTAYLGPTAPEISLPRSTASLDADQVAALRRDMPPDLVRWRQRPPGSPRPKTHGRWVGSDGMIHSEVSGRDEKYEHAVKWYQARSTQIPTRTSDVEITLAVHMRLSEIRSVTLVINNMPCPGEYGCDGQIPKILPKGYSMTVHGARGFLKTYRGES
ncbi:DddA-like double-stranded DNA deaminase toxin [Actinokineospora inagensis]|uniref:DddA-like double-stranded DNA deaminase toxin n=1 Tax=Actinokineospora inagensis TaxID=103730 RepID=UPI000426B2EB|nr:DddA-like double-stranded DNA deaminase toxin [Actinokineospora inagensis]